MNLISNIMKKHKIKVAITVIIVLIYISCVQMFGRTFIADIVCGGMFYDQNSIYKDTSKIIKEYDTFGYNEAQSTITNNKLDVKFNFEGMDTIWTMNAKENETLNIKVDSEITHGKFKLVLIKPNNEVINTVEHVKTGKISDSIELKLQKGENRIKMVGKETATGTLSIEADKGTLKEAGF